MILKEMEYTAEFQSAEILAFGYHRHRRYWVVSYGHHPCCYIEVLKKDESYKKEYDIHYIPLEVHGGITWSGDLAPDGSKGWFLGWDYAHFSDYTLNGSKFNYAYSTRRILALDKWTTETLEKECINAIDQLEPTIWK